MEAKRTEVNHSIYVQGLRGDTTEAQLRDVFSAVGTVEKVFVDTGKKVSVVNGVCKRARCPYRRRRKGLKHSLFSCRSL